MVSPLFLHSPPQGQQCLNMFKNCVLAARKVTINGASQGDQAAPPGGSPSSTGTPSASLSRTLACSVHLSVRPVLCSAPFHWISGASLLSKAHCSCGIQRGEELNPRHAEVLSWKKKEKRKTKEIKNLVLHMSQLWNSRQTANKKWPCGWLSAAPFCRIDILLNRHLSCHSNHCYCPAVSYNWSLLFLLPLTAVVIVLINDFLSKCLFPRIKKEYIHVVTAESLDL